MGASNELEKSRRSSVLIHLIRKPVVKDQFYKKENTNILVKRLDI